MYSIRISRAAASVVASGALSLFCAGAHAASGFKPEEFFKGQTYTAGVVDSAFSDPEPFTSRTTGKVSNGVLSMEERYVFPDARRVQRWMLRPDGQGGYVGTVRTETRDGAMRAPQPVSGAVTPKGATLSYDGYAPNGEDAVLHFKHTFTVQPDGTVKNHVSVSKLGIAVGKADMVMAKTQGALPR